MPKPQEIAELVVNGQIFRDWTSVSVDHRHMEAAHFFEFTATERLPIPGFWTGLKFKPGDRVEVRLAGHVAITGYITHREVAYDARSHGVRLIGRSKTGDLAKSSIISKTGSYDGYSFTSVARSLIAPFGINLETVGQVDEKPFKRLQVAPGERVFPFLARLAAHRKIILGSNSKGNLLAIGQHDAQTNEALVEGVNILSANCEISDEYIYEKVDAAGQQAGDNSTWGGNANKQMSVVQGLLQRYAPTLVPVEHAGEAYDIQKRAEFEAQWQNGTRINALITVQGWLNSQNDLWRVGSYPMVRSPMLMLNQPLGIRRARFTQSSERGTQTLLDLVAPEFMNGGRNMYAGDNAAPPTNLTPEARTVP